MTRTSRVLHQRLALYVKRERQSRGMSRQAMADYIGISESTLQKIENGTYRPQDPGEVLFKVERGMHWKPGSIERIAQGAEPEVIPDPDLARVLQRWPHLDATARRMVADLVELQPRED